MHFIKLLRFKNLVLVALTQVFFQLAIINPFLIKNHIPLSLNSTNWILLILCTVLITAGGNIVNDIFDLEVDEHNNKEGSVVKKMGKPKVWIFYLVVVLLGGAIAAYVAESINNFKLFFIYPAAVTVLFFYSYKFKHIPLIGNIIVSLFTALVLFILLFAERQGLHTLRSVDPHGFQLLKSISIGFMVFAFLANLIREIVKDIQDLEGDRIVGSKTIASYYGKETSKLIGSYLAQFLLILILLWPFYMEALHFPFASKLYCCFLLAIPLLMIVRAIHLSRSSKEFGNISSALKAYMLVGILYLLFYSAL